MYLKSIFIFMVSWHMIFGILKQEDFGFDIDWYDAARYQFVNLTPIDIHRSILLMVTPNTVYNVYHHLPFNIVVDLGYHKTILKVLYGYEKPQPKMDFITLESAEHESEIVLKDISVDPTKYNRYYFIFHCGGIKARYVHFIANEQTYLHNIKIFVDVAGMELHSEQLLSQKVISTAHPFSNYDNVNLAGFSFASSNAFTPITNLDYIGYNDMPMAWFLIKLKDVSYVTKFVVSCGQTGIPDTSLAYRLDEHREFLFYRENGKLKVFKQEVLSNGRYDQYAGHRLEIPFIASHVMIYLMFGLPNFAFRIDFHGFTGNSLSFGHSVIHVQSFETFKNADLIIDLPKMSRVSGIRFHRIDAIHTFCVEYKRNAAYVSYKDYALEEEQTIFFGSIKTGWISLVPFVSTKVKISCITWEEDISVDDLIIYVRGEKHDLPSHRWISSERIYYNENENNSTGIFAFRDGGSGLSIYGNMEKFDKYSPDDRLMSNYIGPDCLTRPDLCENGLSIAFQVYGKLLAGQSFNRIMMTHSAWRKSPFHAPSNYVACCENFFAENYFHILEFNNVEFASPLNIMQAYLKIPVTTIGNPTKIAKVSLFVKGNIAELDNLKGITNWTKDNMSLHDDQTYEINFTKKINEYFQSRRYMSTKMFLIFGLPSVWNVGLAMPQIYYTKAELKMKIRYKVPKTVHDIQISSMSHHISGKHQTVITGFESGGNDRNVQLDGQDMDWDLFSPKFMKTSESKNLQQDVFYRPIDKPVQASNITKLDETFIPIVSKGDIDDEFINTSCVDKRIIKTNLNFNVNYDIKTSDGEEILPIISCGIHGNDTVNQGTGFSMFYTSKELFGVVKTEDKQYIIKVPLTHLQHDKWNSVVLRWNKAENKIKLNVNDRSKENTIPIGLKQSQPLIKNEYLLLFGQYHSKHAYSYGRFQKFTIWKSFITDENVATFENKKEMKFTFQSEKAYCSNCQPLPGCFCENIICPCNSPSGDVKFKLSYDVSTFVIMEIVENKTLEKTGQHWYHHDSELKKDYLHFDNVAEDFNTIYIEKVKVKIVLLNPVSENLEVELYNYGAPHEPVKLIIEKNKKEGESENLVQLFYEQIYKRSSNGILFYINKESMPAMVTAKMTLHASLVINDVPGIITFAHIESSTHWNIVLPAGISCLNFIHEFEGNGFAYLSIKSVHGDLVTFGEMSRIYFNHNEDQENSVELSINASIYEIRFILVKNGLGIGYFKFHSLVFSQDICTNPLNENQEVELTKSMDDILGSSRYPVLEYFVSPDLEKMTTGRYEGFFPNQFYPFYWNKNKEQKALTNFPFIKESSTISFWFYNNGGSFELLFILHGRFSFYIENHIIRFRVYNGKTKKYVTQNPIIKIEKGKWHFFTMTFVSSGLFVSVDFTEKSYGSNGGMINQRANPVIRPDLVICLQYHYHLPYGKDLAHLLKSCPTQHTSLACPPVESPYCARCDQLYGKWIFIKSFNGQVNPDCSQKFSLENVYTYFSFDDDVLDRLENAEYNFIKNQSIETLQQMGIVNNGIYYGSASGGKISLTKDICHKKCFFSSWLNHHCIKEQDATLITTKLFKLACDYTAYPKDNFATINLATKNCGYFFHVKGGLWYHIAIELDMSVNYVKIFIDGNEITTEESCDHKYIDAERSDLFIWAPNDKEGIRLDEMLLNEHNPFEKNNISIHNLIHNYYLKNPEFSAHLPNTHFKFYIKHLPWIDNIYIKGTIYRQQVIDYIDKKISGVTINEIKINVNSVEISKITRCGSDSTIMVSMRIFIRSYEDYNLIKAISIDEQTCELEDLSDDIQYMKTLKQFSSQGIQMIDQGKTFLSFRWTDTTPNNMKMLLKGIYITTTYNDVEITETSYNTDYIMLTGLRSHQVYTTICFYPIHLFTIDAHESGENCLTDGNHKTMEAEPIEKPKLDCIPISKEQIECIVTKINDSNFYGEKHSYKIYSIVTSNATDLHLDVDEWNLTNYITHEQNVNGDTENYTFYVETSYIFKYYTIVAMATTQGGNGLGTRSNVTIRSHGGVPELKPLLKQTKLSSPETILIKWKGVGDDEEIWNSHNKSLWVYVINTMVFKDFDKLENISEKYEEESRYTETRINLNFTKSITLQHHYFIFKTMVAAKNNFETTEFNNSLCLLINNLEPFYRPNDELYIANVSDGDILHSQNISFNDFDLRYWRGKRYYLVIVFAPEKADEESKQTHHIVSTKLFEKEVTDYWLKIITKEFTINYDIDDYMKEGQSCNISHFKSYFQQSSSQFVLLNDLHPSTFYNLSAFACNEITCDLDNYLQSHFVTPEYKPARGPENISLTNSSSTSMVVSFGLIEEFYRHGEIVGYHVKLTCTSKTITRFINETNEITTSEFEGLKIYENCCIIIAGFTLYPAIGNYSQPVCNKTGEDLPTACPLNFKLSARSPTCLNFTWDIVDIKNQNGIIINYVATIMDGVSTQVVVTKDLFINFCNLKRFYEYTVMIQGRTSAGIGENCTIHNVTEEDVPCAPHNISTKAYFTDYIIVEWEDIPEICKNGIILEFLIFYYEVGNDNERIGDIQEKKITDVSLRKTHLKNINPGSKYNISVGGVTSKGLGDKTREITQRFGARVNGNWSEWSKWTPCSASCGLSISSRSRDCNDPIPKDGGSNCTGDDNELRECTEDPCSGYKLAPPGHYDCSIYCASLGMFCSKYVETDFEVVLKDLNIRCDRRDNPKWTEVKHPGMIKKDGLTSCVGFESYPNETKCSIEDDSHETSYQRICKCIHKSDIGFSPWVQWSVCTITCGDSQLRKRTRECSVSGECSGKNSQFSQCVGIPNCPIDGSWSDWTPFEPCNKTCGYGYRNRRRFCDNPVPLYNGQQCPGPKLHAIGECNTHYCPVHGNWNDWSRWSACKEPCGNSNQTRSRECNNPSPDFNGKDCVGNKTQSKGCSPQPPCIENTVHYIFEFTEKQFVYTMNYMHHPDTVKESNRLCQSHHDMVLNNTEINDCQVKTYRKGSVIVEMDVRYKYVNREQIIHVYDRINETKLFSNSKLGFFSVNSTTVSCPPPSNINVKELNGGKVEITYRVERCYDGSMPFQIYVFYIDNELHSQNNAWQWQGLFVTDKPNITIYDLVPMKKFRARLVASNNFGNGNPSHAIYFSSFAGPPLKSPPDLQFISLSSNTIYIDWSDVAVEYRNGQLLGYQVRFKYYLDDEYEEKVVSFGYKSITLEKLRPFTLYAIEVCAFNQGGNGPKDVAVVKTLEGVPSIPVPGVVINSYQAIDWWSISWKAIPDEHINGILLGYRLRYYLAYRSGLPIGGQKSYVIKDFDIFTFNHKENNLLSYATYNVTVTGFTTAGEGPSPELPAKTCHCPEHLFANWYINRPYVELNNEGKLIGIFPDLIKTTIIEACGKCFKYSKSQLYYYSTLSGANPNTGTELELKKRISDEVDVSFPLYGRKEIEAIVPDSVFISIISSPGCALIIRNETNIEGILNNMIMGVISVWPMLLVSYAIATLFGILVWFTDQTENPDEFNVGSSLRGPCIGFWFSFVTMTTIGYGDITPRSILAKSISMVWFLTGLVLNGIVVGFITSAVTSINVVEEHSLYNTLTGALNNSFEQRYSIMRNAKVSDEAYTTVDDVLDALSNSKVDAALIDIYSMASSKPILKKKQLKVVSLIDAHTGYGFALSGMAQVLKPDIESLVIQKQNIIGEFVSSLEDSIPDLSQEQPGSASADIFSATSPAFIISCTYMGILILGLSFFGILFTTVQVIRKRMKVGVAKTQYDVILESSDLLLQFCEHIEEMVNEHTTKIDEELVQLATYHWAYKHKIAKMGKEKVDRMINFSFED